MVISLFVYLAIISGLLGQLVKVGLGGGYVYPQDAAVFFTVLFWSFKKLVSRDYAFKLPSYVFWLFLLIFWFALTLLKGSPEVDFGQGLIGGFYLIRFSFYSLFSLVIYDAARKDSIAAALLLNGLLLSFLGLAQFLIYPDLTSLASEFGYDPHQNRLVSTFLDPNFTGAYLVLALIFLWNTGSVVWARFRLVLICLLLLSLVLTFSRSAWLMLAAVIFLYSLLKSPKLLLISFLVAGLAYFLVPRVQTRISGITDPDDSARSRFVSWQRAGSVFSENKLMGVGFNLFRPAQERFGFFDPSTGSLRYDSGQAGQATGGHAGAGSDSSLLLVMATSGLPGLVIFLFLYGTLFSLAWRRISQPLGLVLVLSLFGLLLESQFINSLFYPPVMLWLWVLVGLTA